MVNLGGILSTWLLGALSPPPQYTSATITLLVFQGGIFAFALLTRVYLAMMNKNKALRRAETGGSDFGTASGETKAATDADVPNDSIWFDYVL